MTPTEVFGAAMGAVASLSAVVWYLRGEQQDRAGRMEETHRQDMQRVYEHVNACRDHHEQEMATDRQVSNDFRIEVVERLKRIETLIENGSKKAA